MIDITRWWAVLTNGEWFVGTRPDGGEESLHLRDLQKAAIQFGVTQNEKGLPRLHIAVMTYPWLRSDLHVPAGALWLRVSEFSNAKDWPKIIETTEQLKLEQRAKGIGLHLVGH
jgi:hypothetical protein